MPLANPRSRATSPCKEAPVTMNKRLLTLACLLAFVPALLRADGIPFDREKGEMSEPYLRLRLSDAQDAQARSEFKLTLTDRQHARLTQRCPRFPKTIPEVFSYRYNDCTCLTGYPYVILLPGGHEAALPKSQLQTVETYGVRDRAARMQMLTKSSPPKKRSWLARCWSWLKSDH